MILPVYAQVDLTNGRWRKCTISARLFEQYLGGKALGARLLTDLTTAGLDPLSPEAVLIVNTGPMNDTGAPSSSRFNMTFKNVLTGGIASSNCGGPFGMLLKKAGFDGLILCGKAPELSMVVVEDGKIRIEACPQLQGLDTERTQEELPERYGKLVIGPAGENGVRFACAASGERVAGRCGAGAVMGSKNLKAVIAYGTREVVKANPEGFEAHTRKWVKLLKKHPMTGDSLPRYGSAGLVSKANASGVLPTHNFTRGRYEHYEEVSGETLADTRLTRNSSCVSCPIRCERRVKVKGKEVKGPEYETLGLFGPNLENRDLDLINELNYKCDLLGMDTISLAGTIAFAMELQEKGMGDFGLKPGQPDDLPRVVEDVAYRRGPAGELAVGSKALSQKYGGADFAIHAKGLELAAYEPRKSVGMGLGYATANRGGCHLNGGYLALLESVGVISMDAQTPKGKPELTVFFQNGMEAASAAGFCLFTMQAMIPGILFKFGPASFACRAAGKVMLSARPLLGQIWKFMPWIMPINCMLVPHSKSIALVTGLPMTIGKFFTVGERSYNVERLYNLREGLTAADDALPGRLTRTPQDPDRPDTVVPLDKMLPVYYKVRGWDPHGVPTAKRLKHLGIPLPEGG